MATKEQQAARARSNARPRPRVRRTWSPRQVHRSSAPEAVERWPGVGPVVDGRPNAPTGATHTGVFASTGTVASKTAKRKRRRRAAVAGLAVAAGAVVADQSTGPPAAHAPASHGGASFADTSPARPTIIEHCWPLCARRCSPQQPSRARVSTVIPRRARARGWTKGYRKQVRRARRAGQRTRLFAAPIDRLLAPDRRTRRVHAVRMSDGFTTWPPSAVSSNDSSDGVRD